MRSVKRLSPTENLGLNIKVNIFIIGNVKVHMKENMVMKELTEKKLKNLYPQVKE